MQSLRQQQSSQTRIKIIQAAYEIVGDNGYSALTSNALIQQAGVAKGTLYHHFSTMDDVIIALMDCVIETFMECMPFEGFNNFTEYTKALGEFQQKSFVEDPRLMNVVYGYLPIGISNHKFHQSAQKMLSQLILKMAPVIRQFYSKDTSDERIKNAIQMIDIFNLGFGVHQNFSHEPEKYLGIWNDFCTLLDIYLSTSEDSAKK